jgi:hypothetical protein
MPRHLLLLILIGACAQAQADEFLRDKGAVEALLSGARLHGTYLRTGTDYTLEFHPDGRLTDGRGKAARWWVNEQGQYCREWLSGRLAGNQACMDIQTSGQYIELHANGKKVAEGELLR